MTASKSKASHANVAKPLPVDASLTERIQVSVDALSIGPADAALVGLALTLARSIDDMDSETKGRMLGQTSGALLHVLRELRLHARPKETPSWSEQHPKWAAVPAASPRRRAG
jgi:hypothetical protein